jgi:hypothetical protein
MILLIQKTAFELKKDRYQKNKKFRKKLVIRPCFFYSILHGVKLIYIYMVSNNVYMVSINVYMVSINVYMVSNNVYISIKKWVMKWRNEWWNEEMSDVLCDDEVMCSVLCDDEVMFSVMYYVMMKWCTMWCTVWWWSDVLYDVLCDDDVMYCMMYCVMMKWCNITTNRSKFNFTFYKQEMSDKMQKWVTKTLYMIHTTNKYTLLTNVTNRSLIC